jgi:hypothetical protein
MVNRGPTEVGNWNPGSLLPPWMKMHDVWLGKVSDSLYRAENIPTIFCGTFFYYNYRDVMRSSTKLHARQ